MLNGDNILKLGQSLPGKGKSSIKQISKLEITTIFRIKTSKYEDLNCTKLFMNCL